MPRTSFAALATLTMSSLIACGSFTGSDATDSAGTTDEGGIARESGAADSSGAGVTGGADGSSNVDGGTSFACSVTPNRLCESFDTGVLGTGWVASGAATISADLAFSRPRSLRTTAVDTTPGMISVTVTAPKNHYTIDFEYAYSAGDICKVVTVSASGGEILSLELVANKSFDVLISGNSTSVDASGVTPTLQWRHAHLDVPFNGGQGSATVADTGTELPMVVDAAQSPIVIAVGSINAGVDPCAFYFDNVDIGFE